MNLEELVRAALAAEAKAEPGEAGAYERFLGAGGAAPWPWPPRPAWPSPWSWPWPSAGPWRPGRGRGPGPGRRPGGAVADLRRDAGPYPAAGTGRDDPARPAAGARVPHRGGPPGAPGVRADPTQGLGGRSVDDPELRPVRPAMAGHLARGTGDHGQRPAADDHLHRRHTSRASIRATGQRRPAPPPGRASRSGSLSGRQSSGRRADGRAFAVGDQGGCSSYVIAWPYRCAAGWPCPEAARWRVAADRHRGDRRAGGAEGPARGPPAGGVHPPDHQRPGPGRSECARGAEPVRGRAGGGRPRRQGRLRLGEGGPQGLRPGVLDRDPASGRRPHVRRVVPGAGAEREAGHDPLPALAEAGHRDAGRGLRVGGGGQGRARAQGRAPVEVATFRNPEFPFTFWVVAPLPPEARPVSFTSFDAAGRRVAKGTSFAGYAKCNP